MSQNDDSRHPISSHADPTNAPSWDRPEHDEQDRWALSSSEGRDTESESASDTYVSEPPRLIGRYEIVRKLGSGGFAIVYLARDRDLDRYVAIKVPRPDRLSDDSKRMDFVDEARKTAQFDHPGIVRIFDVQREPEFAYIVEQYIEGCDLASYSKENSLSSSEIAALMIFVTEAVGYAHDRGFVHRDLKPSNILMDSQGRPHVADFGLAIHESLLDSEGGQLAGTYAFMSPEQVRGESHRLDARSDIWSLGVILYQLLTRRLPFDGSSKEELRSSIVEREPEPPDQSDPRLAGELSRICLTCLAKPASERYQTTDELIADLKLWLASQEDADSDKGLPRASQIALPQAVEPQGLRTFESRHANFFLDLLPGYRDRNGLPRCVRFWKSRIETRNASETFSVGLMYGPSGCGKSSLVHAGILPRLGDQIRPIVVDASTSGAIDRITAKVRAACPEVAGESSLRGMIGALRIAGGSDGRKVLIVIDQFEQFLHGHHGSDQERLALALRQADGAAVQVLILIRDDFFGSINRFFSRLEIPIMEGRNAAMVDLFDPDHASRVLVAFGRAFGKLPDSPKLPGPPQQRFIHRAIQSLAEDGKVSCVRLVIAAEMMKFRPWTESSLREIGGIAGVGVRFLQEQFSSRDAPALHRLHEEAVRNVLRELIAEEGSSLKGPTRTYQELLEASGYRTRPDDFDTVLQILDQDLRLITPADAREAADMAPSQEQRTYQLAHDYLTPAIRQWLSLQQLETRAGRAKLRLEERTRAYLANRQRRNLPSALEFASISLLTRRHTWTPDQKAVMHQARRLYAGGALFVLLVSFLLLGVARLVRERGESRGMIQQLLLSSPENLAEILSLLGEHPSSLRPLYDELDRQVDGSQVLQAAKLRLAIHRFEPGEQVEKIREVLLHPEVPDSFVAHLCDAALSSDPQEWIAHLQMTLQSSDLASEERFRAGVILANSDSSLEGWKEEDLHFLAWQLIHADPEHQAVLRDCLRPLAPPLKHTMLQMLRDDYMASCRRGFLASKLMEQSESDEPLLHETESQSLARALADYAADDVEILCEAISRATPEQFQILCARFLALNQSPENGAKCREFLLDFASQTTREYWHNRLAAGRAKAGAAIALLRLGFDEAVPMVLDIDEDPDPLTQFVHGLKVRGIEPDDLLSCWKNCQDRLSSFDRPFSSSVLYGLLLALGEFDLDGYPQEERDVLVNDVSELYTHHWSSGVHGAAGWLLRRWGKHQEAQQIDRRPVDYEEGREWFTMAIHAKHRRKGNKEDSIFYMTFVVFEPGLYSIGSKRREIGHQKMERRMTVLLPRRFAVLDRELSVKEVSSWSDVSAGYGYPRKPEVLAYGGIDWYGAVRYCRWLTEQIEGKTEWDQAYPDESILDPIDYVRDTAPGAKGAPRNWPVHLDHPGFRLLTEFEWEVACRGGASSTWSFGNDVECFNTFAWNYENADQVMEPRLKPPNLRGLFDMHGNLKEWCHGWHSPLPKPPGPHLDDGGNGENGAVRMVRGGGFQDTLIDSRAGARLRDAPSLRPVWMGLRIAITLPGPSTADAKTQSADTEMPPDVQVTTKQP